MAGANIGTRVKAAAKAVVGVFSEESARQAFGLLSGIYPGGRGEPPVRGTREHLRAYSQMPWLRAVASRVATKVATADWQLYRVGKANEPAKLNRVVQRAKGLKRRTLLKQLAVKRELTEITDHPFLDLLHGANSFQTGDAVRKITQLHIDLVGEAYWLKERNALGTVVGIWPVPPDWVLATPTPAFRFFRMQFRGWRGLIPDTEVLWMTDPDPANPYGRGTGTTQTLADELETDEYAAKHVKQFFFNSARPDFLVYPKNGTMREGETARLEQDWMSHNQGFWRAFKPYFLNREVGVEKFEQNFRSLQLIPLREFERDTVIQTFGMPPELLGVLENSNRATIEAADLVFSRYVVEPRLESMRSILQERMVPEFDERLVLDFVSPVQEDREFHLKAAQAFPYVLRMDELRELAGREPAEDEDLGKMHFMSGSVKPTSEEEIVNPPEPPPMLPGVPPVPGQPKPPKPPAPAAADDDEAEEDEADKAIRVVAGAKSASLKAAAQEPELLRALVTAWQDAQTAVRLGDLEAALAAGDEAAAAIAMAAEVGDAALTAAVEPRLVRAFMRGAGHAADDLTAEGVTVRATRPGVAMDLQAINPKAVAWAKRHAAELVVAGERTRARVRRLVVQAQEDGIPPRDLAKQLRDVIGLTDQQADAVRAFRKRLKEQGVSASDVARRTDRYADAKRRERALTIARTELIASTHGGQQALWDEAVRGGYIDADTMRKVWIVTDDELLEPECEELDGEAVEIDGEFSGGVMHPPLHPRCRCSMALKRVRGRR